MGVGLGLGDRQDIIQLVFADRNVLIKRAQIAARYLAPAGGLSARAGAADTALTRTAKGRCGGRQAAVAGLGG